MLGKTPKNVERRLERSEREAFMEDQLSTREFVNRSLAVQRKSICQ